jgi:hypothetical protein
MLPTLRELSVPHVRHENDRIVLKRKLMKLMYMDMNWDRGLFYEQSGVTLDTINGQIEF